MSCDGCVHDTAAGAARVSNPLMEPFQLLRHCYAFAKASPHPPAPAGFSLAADAEPVSRVQYHAESDLP